MNFSQFITQYDSHYKCSYKVNSSVERFKEIEKREREISLDVDIESEMYRLDLLRIFKLDSYDDARIGKVFDNLLEIIRDTNNDMFMNCLEKAGKLFLSDDISIGMCVLYSYEYMHLTHICISELINNGIIQNDSVQHLHNKLDQQI